ncbi:MAG: dihydropteroate synthase [Gammaproteobacteria bacterium]
MHLQLPGATMSLDRPVVMGILNVTPDSFSDGGDFRDPGVAVRRARMMIGEGAAIIDVGGESTRPGAVPVSVDDELRRVIPVIEALCDNIEAVISVDTTKPEVMAAAIKAGATMINDVNALRAPGALDVAAATGAAVCLMHMQGEPRTMQQDPRYGDVVGEVSAFLADRARQCLEAGIARRRIVVDPGFGFGKTLAHNLWMMRDFERFLALDLALLVGVSRKSMIGAVLDRPVQDRLAGSLALAVLAVARGASIVRVHDVGPTVDALRMIAAVDAAEPPDAEG